jgi:predicted DNA-binding transcriptional regulator YafY
MATKSTVRRNTAVVTEAVAKGKSVRFTYTTAAGDTRRRTVVPVHVEATRHNPDALVVRAKDGLNDRSFRTDRMLRVTIA